MHPFTRKSPAIKKSAKKRTHSSEVGNVDADPELPLVPDRHHGHRHPVLLPVPPVKAAAVEQGLRALEHAGWRGVDDLDGFLRRQLVVLWDECHATVGSLLSRRCWEEDTKRGKDKGRIAAVPS